MTISRSTRNALRMTVLGMLLAGFATLGIAQQARPAKGSPVTTKNAAPSSPLDRNVAADVSRMP